MLSKSTLNKRLPTEKEIEAANLAEQERLASIKDVEIKIRMPDQSALSAKFGQADAGAELYRFVRGMLRGKMAIGGLLTSKFRSQERQQAEHCARR